MLDLDMIQTDDSKLVGNSHFSYCHLQAQVVLNVAGSIPTWTGYVKLLDKIWIDLFWSAIKYSDWLAKYNNWLGEYCCFIVSSVNEFG